MLPALREFDADMLFISAGFDAHHSDPLAQLELSADDFYFATAEIKATAPRVVSVLEGGYDLGGLSKCTTRHLEALLGR